MYKICILLSLILIPFSHSAKVEQQSGGASIRTFSPEQKQALRKAFCDRLKALPWGDVSAQYLEKFEKKEQALLEDFFKLTNSTPEQFKKNWHAKYYRFQRNKHLQYGPLDVASLRSIPLAERTHIDTVLQQAGIGDSWINVMYSRRPDNSLIAARAGFDTIFINSSKIPANENEYKSVIAHELMHFILDDFTTKNLLKEYCDQKHKDFFNRYIRFQEKRADILGFLLSPEYARAFANGCKLALPHGIPHHPEFSKRAAYLHKLYTQTDPECRAESKREQERHDPLYRFIAA